MNFDVKDFGTEVIGRSKEVPVLVDFWAEWCGPCKVLGPVLEKLAAQADGNWVLAKVNTEAHRDVAARYDIRSIPNVKLFVDGTVETEFVGALPEPMVKHWLQKNIPSKSRKEIELAEKFFDEKRIAEAKSILHKVVGQEPDNHQARVLLARILLETDPPRARELAQGIEADSKHFEMAEAIRTLAALFDKNNAPTALPEAAAKGNYLKAIATFLNNDYAAALEQFIEVIREDRYYDDDGSRKVCIAIFRLLGDEHEITKQYRREFSRALY